MAKATIWAILGLLLFAFGPAEASPVRGQYRKQRSDEKYRVTLEGHTPFQFKDTFRVGQRACVIVEGDLKESLTLKITDIAGNITAQDLGGGNCVSVMWYPPRTQLYYITITSTSTNIETNELDIVVK